MDDQNNGPVFKTAQDVEDLDRDMLDGADSAEVDTQERAQEVGLQRGDNENGPEELDLNRDMAENEAATEGKIRPEDEELE